MAAAGVVFIHNARSVFIFAAPTAATAGNRSDDEHRQHRFSSSDESDSDGESPPGTDDKPDKHQKKRKKDKKLKKKDKKKAKKKARKHDNVADGTRRRLRWSRSFKVEVDLVIDVGSGDDSSDISDKDESAKERSVLVSLANSLVADVLVSTAREILKAVEKDEGSSYQFFVLLACDKNENATINVSIYADCFGKKSTGQATARAVGSLQQQLVNMFWDRLFRIKDVGCVRKQMETLPVCALELHKFPEEYEPDSVPMRSEDKYCAMVMFEIEIVRCMTLPFAEDGSGGTQRDNLRAKACVKHKDKLGEKMRGYLRVGLAKKLWSAVAGASKKCLSMESILQRCTAATQTAAKAKDAIIDIAAFLEWASDAALVDQLLAVRTCLESAEEMVAEAEVPADLRHADGVVAGLVIKFGNDAVELYAELVVSSAPAAAAAAQARQNVMDGRPVFLGLWKLMRSYATDAKAWMDVNENLAKCYASATSEVTQLLTNAAAVEHSLDAGHGSKQQQQDTPDAASDVEQEKVDVPACLQNLAMKMFNTVASFADRPATWFKALVRAQKHGEVLEWEASVRAQLGFQVEKLVRGFVLVDDFLGKKKSVPFSDTAWRSKAAVRESATAISDLGVLESENPGENELPGVKDALVALTARATGTVEGLVHDMRNMKDSIRTVYDDTCKVMSDVDGMDDDSSDFPETLRAVVDKYNQSGSPMQDATKGALDLKKLEDVAEAFQTWAKDFPECVATGIKHLSEQLSMAPTSVQALCGIYNTMAMEIVLRASGTPAEDAAVAQENMEQVQKDANGIGKFMAGQLMLSKKDVAGKIQFRLEKIIKSGKDCAVGLWADLGSSYSFVVVAHETACGPGCGSTSNWVVPPITDLNGSSRTLQEHEALDEKNTAAWYRRFSGEGKIRQDFDTRRRQLGLDDMAMYRKLTTNSKIYDFGRHQLLQPPHLMAATGPEHGFDVSKLVMGCDFRRSTYSRMCGNAMSVPVVGAVLLAVLMTTGVRDEYTYPRLHFRSASSALADKEVPDDMEEGSQDCVSEADAESGEL
ncbi:unnamed protein product [Symbiodinium sp. CCMP2592]|nr:unnamed protein product [Symbiodinium sp. CCMP2592]CAE7431746.1 unnamed protein product [Symbiodinium sp. CCMP2592]